MNPQDLPDVQFDGDDEPIDWRTLDDEDPDDEELEVTPEGVTMMLGFDPKTMDDEDESQPQPEQTE